MYPFSSSNGEPSDGTNAPFLHANNEQFAEEGCRQARRFEVPRATIIESIRFLGCIIDSMSDVRLCQAAPHLRIFSLGLAESEGVGG
jgi:hypothetical protein